MVDGPSLAEEKQDETKPVKARGAVKGARAAAGSSRDRFLQAADDQFIAHGYDGCTIRAIAAQAGTSLASLSRNWNSKQHLFEEVFKRHFDPVHQLQNEQFDELERRGDLTVKSITRAFFRSAMSKGSGDGDTRKSHHIYCLALIDPSEEARVITRALASPVRLRVTQMMRKALPDMDEQRFFLAMAVVLGVYLYPQTQAGRLAGVLGFDLERLDWTGAADILAEFVSTGLTGGGPA